MFHSILARFVALVGAAMIVFRRATGGVQQPVFGPNPTIPAPVPQGSMPNLKMPTARGWKGDEKPVAAPGLKVNAFARNLRHPRQIYVLPNGDVLASESLTLSGTPRTFFDHAMTATMKRAAANGVSPNRIMLLRDANRDGTAEIIEPFLVDQRQPYGMALKDGTLYIGNTDAVVAFPYTDGDSKITAPGRTLMTMKTDGHWTRNLLLSPDGSKLYVAVGSKGNIDENGAEAEAGRACIYELDLATGQNRIFAGGLRNPVGMAWEPTTGVLHTVVNERDGLGDEVPPDYLTSVRDGGFYGWPIAYYGIVDDRAQPNPELAARSLVPDYALGGHTASLGLCWMPARCLASAKAWSSVSTARGTALSSRATRWSLSSSRTASRPARRRATSSPASSAPTSCSPMAARWAPPSAPTASRSSSPTTSATSSGASPAPERHPKTREAPQWDASSNHMR